MGGSAKRPGGFSNEPTYAGRLGFARQPQRDSFEGAGVVVLGAPFDLATTNRPGARFGPRAIREASAQLAWGPVWPWDFDPFEVFEVVDGGDVHFDEGYVEQMLAALEARVAEVAEAGAASLVLGGDHLVALASLRAHARRHGKLSLVHFDAHSDTWREDPLNHGSMFFHALEEGLIDPAHSVQVGIRTHNDETHGFEILDAREVRSRGPAATAARICEIVGARNAYLTFDVDCLDPAFAPGTGTPVVGGMSTAEAREIVWGLSALRFVGADVVEVAPPYDVANITALAGATLAMDFIYLHAERRRAG